MKRRSPWREAIARGCCVVLATTLVPCAAAADVISCTFTEPFLNTVYSSSASTLTVSHNVEARSGVLRNVSLQILGPGRFELWNAKREVVQRLQLSSQGSDGMSDQLYPYAVQWTPGDPQLPETLHGGCTSNHLRGR